MNLWKIRENSILKTDYYSTSSAGIQGDSYFLIGFKDNLQVLRDSKTTMETPQSKNKVVMVVVDPLSGEKYLNINGKKLKMVRESLMTQSVGERNPSVKQQPGGSKNLFCVGPRVKLNKQEINSNYTTTADAIQVNKPILDKNRITEIKNNDKNPSLNKIVEGNSTLTDTHSKVTILNGKCFSESLKCLSTNSTKPNSMEAMNLSTNINNRKVLIKPTQNRMKSQKSVGLQFSPDMVDRGVQTESLPPSDADLLDPNLDLMQFLESDCSVDEKHKPIISKEQRLFHEDLKSCLIADRDGNLPIHVGVVTNDVKKVKRMCTVLTARGRGINVENHNNFTPLQLAILTDGSIDIFRILMQYGASLENCDEEGNNVLHLAVKWEREYILDEILQYALQGNFNLNSFNFEGLTPLMLCCINGLYECAKILIKYLDNEGINTRDQKSGRTALFHAAESQHVPLVRLLLDHKADTKIKNFFGTSPHDAMYELDDIPADIKTLIFGKKRRLEEPPAPLHPKKPVPKKNLRMYSRLKKVTDIDLTAKKPLVPTCQ